MRPGARPPYAQARPASNLQRPAPLPTHGFRNFLIVCLLILGVFVAYAYSQNPAGCLKVVDDAHAVVLSLLPAPTGKDAPLVGASIGKTEEPSANSVTVNASNTTNAAPGTTDHPPVTVNGLPEQPNWTWTTLDGKTYQNVVITKMEPETVSITHSTGVSHLPVSILSSDIKKRLGIIPGDAPAPSP